MFDFLGKGCYYNNLGDKEMSVEIDKNTVEYIAHLARIKLNTQELEKFSRQFQGILSFIDKLKQIDTRDILPTSHILSISNVLRQDDPGASLSSEEALKNAPQKADNFFGVPRVIE